MEAFSGLRSFIVVSELKDFKDTGGIFDANDERLLAYFRHEHNWRTPRGPIKIWRQARSTDIYLENANQVLFGEINEIPPKLFSMRLIRTFEIYNERKELVGVVREKPKAVGSDWVLEDLKGKVIGVVVGERKKKDYEIRTPDGQVLVRCYREVLDRFFGGSQLDMDSYRFDVLGGGVDLFLLLGYVLVLEFAKLGWTTRGSFLGRFIGKPEVDKEHLLKTRTAQAKLDNIQSYETAHKNAKRTLALTLVQSATFLAVDLSWGGLFLSFIGVFGLAFAFLRITNIKTKEFNMIMILNGIYAVVCIPLSLFSAAIVFEEGPIFALIFAVLAIVASFAVLISIQISMGLYDFIKK